MSTLWAALALAALAGASIPLGAWIATYRSAWPGWLESEGKHGVLAFGAGALLAAVSLVLLPEGIERLSPWAALFWFFVGGFFFAIVDKVVDRTGGKAAQFIAMMTDYLPEAIALGALITADPRTAILVAVLIALQNFPEGFNAMREMASAGSAPLWLFLLMVPLGPLAAWIGLSLPPDQDHFVGAIMMLASGGILFLMFQDIAPQVPLERESVPTFGAVLGFGMGLAGHVMI